MGNVPKVRFNGFDDDWEQRKLGDIADVTKLAGFEFTEHVVYSDEGNIIALRGLNIKNGQLVLDDVKYIDGSNFAKLNRSKLFIDDIMFTYVGTVGEVAIIKENDRFYLAPNVSRIRVQSNDSPKFISHYMRTDSFYRHVIFPLIATSSQPALSMENIRKFEICLPKNRDEQDKLSEFLDDIDHLITLHQRKCDETKELKKYMLQKMFPKKGEKVPEIRFEGFTDDWEQRKFDELYKKVSRKNDMTYGTNDIISVANMYYKPDAVVKNEEYLKTYNIFELGDIAFEGNKSKNYAHGRFVENTIGNGIVSHVFDVFSPITEYDLSFWKHYINCESVMGPILTRVTKASTMMTNLVAKDFLKEKIRVPSLEEQQRIGAYLDSIENLITLHQRKCDELKMIKKAMLQQMFV